jgi:hypothetical protein
MSRKSQEVCRITTIQLHVPVELSRLISLTSYTSSIPHISSLLTIIIVDDEGNTSSRPLGLLVARGTLLVLISPLDGSEEIPNPFVQAEEGEGAAAI